MSIELNATHDPARRSWVESANVEGCDFPIQNLPFCTFRALGDATRAGVGIGDQIIAIGSLSRAGLLQGPAAGVAALSLKGILESPPAVVSELRKQLSDLFRDGGTGDPAGLAGFLAPTSAVALELPVKPPAFADFCCSIDHMRRMAVSSGRPVAPCADKLPASYNGRASSVAVSGTPVVRPWGQFETPPGSGEIVYGIEPRLDYELEFAAWLRGGNAHGTPISVAEAESMIFGCGLVNDWSARGIQFFESMFGPHLGKSFLTSVSPWIVTMEALAPFRVAARGRDAGEPAVPAHLLDAADRISGGIRIALTADLATATSEPVRIVTTGFETMFWTFAQMVAHQASSGAPLEAGDLVASGTVSGPADDAKACLVELTERGANPVLFADGSKRVWLEDGDTVTITAKAHADGHVPIGFGSCVGTVHPALARPAIAA